MSHKYAIKIDHVSKAFRRWDRARKFLTLKSALLRGELLHSLRDKKDAFYALRDVSFTMQRGTTVGIIGRNGSGKSTLLKLIAGITKPTSGRIIKNGKVSALLELGAGFHPEISGRENIFINGIMLGLSRRELRNKYEEIIAFSELGDFIDAPVKTYSSGMYMRLAFSVAVNVDPDILLIDEVLAVGDKAFTDKCMDKIYDFKKRNKTIVFVSHGLGTVEKLCDQVIWLDKGAMAGKGDPIQVVESYLMKMAEDEDKRLQDQEHKQQCNDAEQDSLYEETCQHTGRRYQVEVLSQPTAANPYPRKRWGSQEVTIDRVSLLNKAGQKKSIFRTGEDITIRMDYQAKDTIRSPVFGIALFRNDNIQIYGTNTFIDRFDIPAISGKGTVDIAIRQLNLLPGVYFLDVAAHTEEGFPYDYHFRLYSFKVYSHLEDVGIYRLDHRWRKGHQADEKTNHRPV